MRLALRGEAANDRWPASSYHRQLFETEPQFRSEHVTSAKPGFARANLIGSASQRALKYRLGSSAPDPRLSKALDK